MTSDEDEDSILSLDSIFTEPARPPTPKPTFSTYTRTRTPQNKLSLESDSGLLDIRIKLVGSHPLWGHYLWNAARSFASYIDANPDFVRDRFVLELGAGGGLPGIISALNGAQKVILTDYPDAALLDNIDFNIAQNVPSVQRSRIEGRGYIWGNPVDTLLQTLPATEPWRKFDLIILSDLVFNHSQHDALLLTCELCLTPLTSKDTDPAAPVMHPAPSILVFYTHHRPHLAHRDLGFFAKARERGWKCDELLTEKFPPMFPEDPGAEEVRSTVHGWLLTRKTN
ncbi:hypothetical protein SERLADRAFT_471345 [Serpula lacrymans var. lacrymans S7.9]|uniref:Protein N-terminal and lysine N-methyltransferase EFM7 n=1 Tax=Serpula lacrymans var. lacrymans (strain S7.9) TaxID=578457 RepID=F8P135_SERL9|nr:uncharacterized protein SERLADRAFT_471345 [Serpula lacrymans var. lacrymans S7.9]EGO22866.1 hypothetical protein SERLADRAFT_471345 [Serpula lacrymans var. lacrymans S7.9]